MRDLKADLELCQKAIREPEWCIESIDFNEVIIKSRDLTLEIVVSVGGCYPNNEKYTRDYAEFIVASCEGWPEAIERALAAEVRVKELETAIGELLAVLASYDKKGEHKELFDRIIRM